MLQLSVPVDNGDNGETLPDNFVRYLLAGNPHVPVATLARLARDPRAAVRRRVAENPTANTEILLRLALDADAEVRMGVSENQHAPTIFLEQLSIDDNADVRFFMAENINLPERILSALSSDSNPYVSTRAAKTLACKRNGKSSQVTAPVVLAWPARERAAQRTDA